VSLSSEFSLGKAVNRNQEQEQVASSPNLFEPADSALGLTCSNLFAVSPNRFERVCVCGRGGVNRVNLFVN